ncbi:MAG TPA: phenylalanine--tRNA ligase subunit alpha [Myxococcota bacterium]|nr:phenylalanine--tRNA ligase subunit alpha [Myxococcota bacterium]
MIQSIDSLPELFRAALRTASTSSALEEVQREFLGKKSVLKQAFQGLRALSPEDRAAMARRLNELQQEFEQQLSDRRRELEEAELETRLRAEWQDLSMPGTAPRRGALHPVTQVERRCLEVLRRLGFVLEEGPEVESEDFNFDYLNIPKHHPAREMQDTFYVTGGLLLRSHTTSVQARVLKEGRNPPIKVASAGRVYRNEATDATHLPMFHQLEGFWLEEGLSFAHLKGILDFVAREIYGQDSVFRIKPKFYPYTEPSIGMDIRCTSCNGVGCAACHGAGWVTIIGAGMIHRNVLTQFGYDPDKVSGLAFGWGTTRMASQWTGVKKVKSLYQQDLRLLRGIHRRNP